MVESLPPDADFVVVHDGQPPGYVDVSEKEHGSENRVTDSLLGGWMYLQSNNTEGLPGRESNHIGEIGIQRHKYAAVLNSEAQDVFVVGSRETDLRDCNRVVPLRSQLKSVLWREVFV